MSCGIYKITNKINNKIYIGQSVNIQQRFYTHCSDALTKQDNNSGSMIRKSIKKKTSAYGFQWREEKQEKISAYDKK